MNGPGHELFSGAGFAEYQNSCIGGRDDLNAFQDGLKGCPLTDHIAVVVIEPDFVFEVKLLGSEPLLDVLELPVCQSVFHGDGNLSCDLHQKIDIFIRPNVARGPGEFERTERAIAGDQRNRAGRLAAQLHEPAVFRRGIAVHIHIVDHDRFAGRERLRRRHALEVDRPLPCQRAEPR